MDASKTGLELGLPPIGRHIPRQVAKEFVMGETVTSSPVLGFIELIRGLQPLDPACRDLAGKATQEASWAGYHLLDDLLFFKNRLVIPAQGSLRQELLRRHHDDPRAGHGGSARTLELLQRNYHWEGIADNVKDYVGKCAICQGNQVPQH